MEKFFNLFKESENSKENFSSFEISKKFSYINFSELEDIKSILAHDLPSRDEYACYIFEEEFPEDELNIKEIESEDDLDAYLDSIIIKLKITKKVSNNVLSIYNLEEFENFFADLPTLNLLKVIDSYVFKKKVSQFEILSQPSIVIFSNSIFSISGKDVKIIPPRIDRESILQSYDYVGKTTGFWNLRFIPDRKSVV